MWEWGMTLRCVNIWRAALSRIENYKRSFAYKNPVCDKRAVIATSNRPGSVGSVSKQHWLNWPMPVF
jgi:hypothetical protein